MAGTRVTLDDIVHTGPGSLGGRYMRTFWQPVSVASELPPGRAAPIRVMSEDFTLYRGEACPERSERGGTPHVVAFRCAHRGTQLSTGWVEGDCIRCFYHGWKYAASGQCVEQPAEDASFAAKVRIQSYPTQEYLGLIFAYFGEGEPPPLPRYPELEDEGVLEVNDVVIWPCNFFNRIENSGDEVHVAFVHGDSGFSENGLVDIPQVWAEETEFGFTKYGQRPNGAVRVSHFHMPNANFIKGSPNEDGAGWVEHLSWRVPVDDESCASYTMSLTHVGGEAAERYRRRRQDRLAASDGSSSSAAALGPAVLRGELSIEDIADRTFIVNVQDYVAQVGQGAIADRTHERLGRSDAVVILMRKLWLRELQALADGRSLKRWARSGRLAVTAGVDYLQPYRRFSVAERDRRWAALRRLMERDRLDAIVAPPNNGNSTDWQADARYISHCGGGADASIGTVFPLVGDVTVVATSAKERWGPHVQDWVADVREVKRRYGRGMAERLLELGLERGRVGVTGLAGGTRTPEGSIFHGTYTALRDALPKAELIDAANLLQEVREVKSEEEIDVLQRSVELIEHGVRAQAHWAQPGVPDYVVWAEAMHAMFVRGSELSVHFNWISSPKPGRTLTRPTNRPLERGDLIVAEIESSVIGYRAQQIRPVAVHDCDPVYKELARVHAELYSEMLGFLKPGVTPAELLRKLVDTGDRVRPRSGLAAGCLVSTTLHGRGLGDDRPLVLSAPGAIPDYEGTERALNLPLPENGVYIFKPTVWSATREHQFVWGDTIRTTPRGCVRMGTAVPGMLLSTPAGVSWPSD